MTSAHSAEGLPAEGFLVAKNANKFAEHIVRLRGSFEERQDLGEEAYKAAREHFFPEACFGELLERLGA